MFFLLFIRLLWAADVHLHDIKARQALVSKKGGVASPSWAHFLLEKVCMNVGLVTAGQKHNTVIESVSQRGKSLVHEKLSPQFPSDLCCLLGDTVICCLVHAWSSSSRERDDSALFATLYLSHWECRGPYLMWKHHVTPERLAGLWTSRCKQHLTL